MKKMLLVMMFILVVADSRAQFKKADLQATGLTCALCSQAINKALQKLSFVESVKPDIKNSAFYIVFRQNTEVDIDAVKNAVEDAGFSVGSLKLTGTFHEVEIGNDQHVKIGKEEFHFLNVSSQILNGEKTITMVDKNFVSAKEFKKYSGYTKMSCIKTGKAGPCCAKDNIPVNTRIYHVTI
jgi:copper chaperone CopZ